MNVDYIEEISFIDDASEEFKRALAQTPTAEFSENEIYVFAELIVDFAQKIGGIEFHPYQYEPAIGVAFSVLVENAEEITLLFARQSGKTEMLTCLIIGFMVLLPILANLYPNEKRFAKYKNGFWVGVFGPNEETATIIYNRMRNRLKGENAQLILNDPEINLQLPKRGHKVQFNNGSYVQAVTAAPTAKIEGKTFHIAILEEAQDINDYKIRKSITPMLAATAGTIVKVGTPIPRTCDFEQACKRNKRRDLDIRPPFPYVHFHYEYDYTIAVQYNYRYAKFIEKERMRMGEDSDEFRMAYRLHWLADRGKFLTEGIIDDCGITEREILKKEFKDKKSKKKITLTFVRPSYPTTFDVSIEDQVAAIDFGKEDSSTVITVARVWWDNPIILQGLDDEEIIRFYIHVQNWLEIHGDDHEAQYPQIKSFLQNFNLGTVVCDSTGPGDPITSRLAAELEELDIQVYPFVFSTKSKDIGYKILRQEMYARRFTYPAGKRSQKTRKFKRFLRQFYDLQKQWRGSRLVVQCPNEKNAHDDYPDSAMLVVQGVTTLHEQRREIDCIQNPMLGRQARREQIFSRRRYNAWSQRRSNMRNR